MELNENHRVWIEQALCKYPEGATRAELWTSCPSFDTESEFSLALHKMGQQGLVFKRAGKYVGANVEPGSDEDSADEKIALSKPEDSPSIPISATPLPVINAEKPTNDTKTLPFGTLRRSPALGAAALALFKLRSKKPISLKDISTITGAHISSLYAALDTLVDLKYVVRSGAIRNWLFEWSGNFRYPFKSLDMSDDSMLAMTVDEFERLKNGGYQSEPSNDTTESSTATALAEQVEPPIAVPNNGGNLPMIESSLSNVFEIRSNLALNIIDAQIDAHNHHIKTLNALRTLITLGTPQ